MGKKPTPGRNAQATTAIVSPQQIHKHEEFMKESSR